MQDPFAGANNMLLDGTIAQFAKMNADTCKELLAAKELLESLAREKYDVGIAEAYDICLFGIFHALGVPTKIATFAIHLSEPLNIVLGIPSPSSFVPVADAATVSGDQMGYVDRAKNLLFSLYEHFRMVPLRHNLIQPLLNEAFGPDFPNADSIVRNVSLAFINANPFLALARPITHKIRYIGGIVEHKPKTLSQELNQLFHVAQKGVILFSFGTMADTDQMPDRLKYAFLDAFTSFHGYHVIWKYRPNDADIKLLRNYTNVHTFDWIDQVSILAHPKTVAFVTHCGLNGLNEAATYGVPVVAIPLFGDQLYNAGMVTRRGMGVYLDVRRLTAESIKKALSEILFAEK
ncbi:CRE-UGT-54 protein [Aphelenchoides avenae]|nr:CRE-UGT-54 protein [Aphelenchus avenae]